MLRSLRNRTSTHGDFPLAAIALGSISHVEVIRGPGAVLYGSNASAGVINVVTRRDGGSEAQLQLELHDQHRAEWLQQWPVGNGQLALAHADDAVYDGEFTERPLPPVFPQDTARSGEIPRDKRMNSAWMHFFTDKTDVHYHAFETESLGRRDGEQQFADDGRDNTRMRIGAQRQWQTVDLGWR